MPKDVQSVGEQIRMEITSKTTKGGKKMKRAKIKKLKEQIKDNPIFDKKFKDGLFVSNFYKEKGTAIFPENINDEQIDELRKMGYIMPSLYNSDRDVYCVFIFE